MKSLFICAHLFLFAFAGVAHAEAPKVQESVKKKAVGKISTPAPRMTTSILTYDVYAGGIHAMDAQLAIKADATKYEASLTAATQGILKKMANWSGKFLSKGLISKGVASPQMHQSASTWKNKTETKTFKYDGKGHFLSYRVSEGGVDKTPTDIDLALAKDTTDTLSSTMSLLLSLPTTQACAGNDLIFDGDRNFRLKFKDTKTETLAKSDYNIYSGPSVYCSVEVIPEQGKWRKKPRGWLSIQEQGRNKGSLPTIWFGQVKGQANLYVPIKIRIKTDYGTLFMHLTSAKTS